MQPKQVSESGPAELAATEVATSPPFQFPGLPQSETPQPLSSPISAKLHNEQAAAATKVPTSSLMSEGGQTLASPPTAITVGPGPLDRPSWDPTFARASVPYPGPAVLPTQLAADPFARPSVRVPARLSLLSVYNQEDEEAGWGAAEHEDEAGQGEDEEYGLEFDLEERLNWLPSAGPLAPLLVPAQALPVPVVPRDTDDESAQGGSAPASFMDGLGSQESYSSPVPGPHVFRHPMFNDVSAARSMSGPPEAPVSAHEFQGLSAWPWGSPAGGGGGRGHPSTGAGPSANQPSIHMHHDSQVTLAAPYSQQQEHYHNHHHHHQQQHSFPQVQGAGVAAQAHPQGRAVRGQGGVPQAQGRPYLLQMQGPVTLSKRQREAQLTWPQELLRLAQLALPCICITGCPQVIIVVSQVYAGHIGTTKLAAVALGNTLWTLLYYFLLGASTALETLGAQAVGARDFRGLVVWDFAAFITCSLLAVPLAGVLWNADIIVNCLMGVDKAVAQATLRYCKQLVPGLLPQVWAIVMSKHLQVRSNMLLPAFVCAAVGIVHVLVTAGMVELLGTPGIGWACSVTRCLFCIGMACSVAVYEKRKGTQWGAPSTWLQGWHRWRRATHWTVLARFMRIAIPGGMALALEVAAFEITTALASYLGQVQVAAHASAFSLVSLAYMCIPGATAVAVTVRVAAFLGGGYGEAAWRSARIAMTFILTLTSTLAAVLVLWADQVGWLFTDDDELMVRMVSEIAPLVAAYQAISGLLGVSQGVMRGIGRQGQLLLHGTLGWGAGIALATYLTFGSPQLGLPGLWLGTVAGVAIVSALNLLALALADWGVEVSKARALQAIRQELLALEEDGLADERVVEALLEEALNDPRPSYIVYQHLYSGDWTGSRRHSNSGAGRRGRSHGGLASMQSRTSVSGRPRLSHGGVGGMSRHGIHHPALPVKHPPVLSSQRGHPGMTGRTCGSGAADAGRGPLQGPGRAHRGASSFARGSLTQPLLSQEGHRQQQQQQQQRR